MKIEMFQLSYVPDTVPNSRLALMESASATKATKDSQRLAAKVDIIIHD